MKSRRAFQERSPRPARGRTCGREQPGCGGRTEAGRGSPRPRGAGARERTPARDALAKLPVLLGLARAHRADRGSGENGDFLFQARKFLSTWSRGRPGGGNGSGGCDSRRCSAVRRPGRSRRKGEGVPRDLEGVRVFSLEQETGPASCKAPVWGLPGALSNPRKAAATQSQSRARCRGHGATPSCRWRAGCLCYPGAR